MEGGPVRMRERESWPNESMPRVAGDEDLGTETSGDLKQNSRDGRVMGVALVVSHRKVDNQFKLRSRILSAWIRDF